MPVSRIYPLLFEPVLRDYVWGGRRLETLFGRTLPQGIVAESWEISGHPSAPTRAVNGMWAGRPLPEIMAELGVSLVGAHGDWALSRNRFPLLVKLLDAHEDLSVQVHPGDEYARLHEQGELGKSEMWYVLHADPGAALSIGVEPGTTRAAFFQALQAGQLESVLRHLTVKPGDAVAIPAGLVHALRAGIVVTEIQQTSDATYRVYDWGRVGPDGRSRPLHIEKALQVMVFDGPPAGLSRRRALPAPPGTWRVELTVSRYFAVEEIQLEPGSAYAGVCDGTSMEIWGCMAGEVTVRSDAGAAALPAVSYMLLPAALGGYSIEAAQGRSTCLRVYLPPPPGK